MGFHTLLLGNFVETVWVYHWSIYGAHIAIQGSWKEMCKNTSYSFRAQRWPACTRLRHSISRLSFCLMFAYIIFTILALMNVFTGLSAFGLGMEMLERWPWKLTTDMWLSQTEVSLLTMPCRIPRSSARFKSTLGLPFGAVSNQKLEADCRYASVRRKRRSTGSAPAWIKSLSFSLRLT